jgi:hypothetical protein
MKETAMIIYGALTFWLVRLRVLLVVIRRK